ncbi:MAG: response regulator [Flexibacteraceae bacterium]
MLSSPILIVEDDHISQLVLRTYLTRSGFTNLHFATNADEALVILAEHAITLMLLDVFIYGSVNGLDLAEMVKEKYGTPIIFTTANSDRFTYEKAQKVGPADFITKPYDIEEVTQTIVRILGEIKGAAVK